MKFLKVNTYKGTRILVGDQKRIILDRCIGYLKKLRFQEIQIPIINHSWLFDNKIGENKHLMFTFEDRKSRQLCLAPEYTAIIQELAKSAFAGERDLKLFYVGECFRGENPQYGRWRQFTQLGVEVINPTEDHIISLRGIARALISNFLTPSTPEWYDGLMKLMRVDSEASRGLDYYKGPGFEIHCKALGTASQICGGGTYQGGQGFALGIDRLLIINENVNNKDFLDLETAQIPVKEE